MGPGVAILVVCVVIVILLLILVVVLLNILIKKRNKLRKGKFVLGLSEARQRQEGDRRVETADRENVELYQVKEIPNEPPGDVGRANDGYDDVELNVISVVVDSIEEEEEGEEEEVVEENGEGDSSDGPYSPVRKSSTGGDYSDNSADYSPVQKMSLYDRTEEGT